jgi:indole-3-glycerol phosphate synthase
LAERGGRRFSQAISEGDGISVIVHVDGPEAARMAEGDGAEAVVVRTAIAGIRDATELPILWHGGGNPDDAQRMGADAMVVVAEDHDDDDDDDGLGAVVQRAAGLGLDLVVSVASEDMLERVLEQHDPETFHLASRDLERALDLLSDVPVGKLAIAEVGDVTREQVVELERRGVDAVIVPARNVAELVGGAPPAV